MRALAKRVTDATLAVLDALHVIRRDTLRDWQETQRVATQEAEKTRDANTRDLEAMHPDERQEVQNRLERAYRYRRGGSS